MPKSFVPDRATRHQITKFFSILATDQQRNHMRIKDFEQILPVSMARWNKLQILNGGNQIRYLEAASELSTLGKRDNSFVMVSHTLSCCSLMLTGHLVYPFPGQKQTGTGPVRHTYPPSAVWPTTLCYGIWNAHFSMCRPEICSTQDLPPHLHPALSHSGPWGRHFAAH
jgi:hypothetical protein